MSALQIAVSRKRHQYPGYRDSSASESDDSDCVDLPPRKKRKDEDIPLIIGTRLWRMTNWFLEINSFNKFARMALKYGGHWKLKKDSENVEVDTDDLEEDSDGIEEDDDDDIQEIKENVTQDEMSPLVKQLGRSHFSNDSGLSKQQKTMNGSYSLGSQYNSPKLNGALGRQLSSRCHGTTKCNIRRQQAKQEREPLISNPPTDIEVVLLDNEPEGDGLEIVSESPSSKQISVRSRNSFRSSAKCVSPKKPMLAHKRTHSTPVPKSCSSPPKSYTANDVVRLQEKEQYKLLLEKYIKQPSYQRFCSKPQSNERSKDNSRLFSNSHFKKEVLDQPVGSFIEKYYTPCRLLPPKEESSGKKKEAETVTIDDDDDVQVIEMKLPQYKPVFKSAVGSSEWLAELGKHVEKTTEERNKIVLDYERKLEKYKKERLLRRLKIDAGPAEPEFPELTPEMEEAIDNVFKGGAPTDFICRTINNNNLVRKDFDTLQGLSWLNDAIINCYFDLIVERSKKEGFPSVYAFNTFFYSSLKTKGYSAVRRWTRKVDIFSFDLNFIPLHLTYHWCLAVIDHRSKKISYYDSMGTGEEACLDILHDYLCQEHRDKKGTPLDPSIYVTETMQDIPQQMNGSDCGMFSLKFAEYISRDAEITFDQAHMPYFRRRAVYELLTNQFL